MKVSQLIKQLERYKPDDDLIVAYWDKEIVESYSGQDLGDDDWQTVVELYEDGEWYWQGSAGQDFVELVKRVIDERETA